MIKIITLCQLLGLNRKEVVQVIHNNNIAHRDNLVDPLEYLAITLKISRQEAQTEFAKLQA
ncbi:hypothetical protein [Ligilactobacillus equi]